MDQSFSFHPARILCAVDLSEVSNLALKYAAVGAKAYGAALIVFHAERFELPAYFTSSQVDELTRQLKSERRQAQTYLGEHTKKILGQLAEELELSLVVGEAHPVDAILEAANEQRADLLVLGTHGRGGAKRLWLGSVAENVVRHAEVPVFIVRQKQHEFIDANRPEDTPRLKNILCPVNFSPVAGACLQVANSIAQRFAARLMPVCILEPGERRNLAEAQAQLQSWVSSIVTNSSLECLTRKGRAAEEIVAFARTRKADLIVLGAQRNTSAGSWLWGGTTEVVLREAPAPVLVVPRLAAEKTIQAGPK